MTETTWYLDEDGYKVEIGAIVGYYEGHPEMDKLFRIVSMPNYANTLVVTEVKEENGQFVDIDAKVTQEVDSYKLSAI